MDKIRYPAEKYTYYVKRLQLLNDPTTEPSESITTAAPSQSPYELRYVLDTSVAASVKTSIITSVITTYFVFFFSYFCIVLRAKLKRRYLSGSVSGSSYSDSRAISGRNAVGDGKFSGATTQGVANENVVVAEQQPLAVPMKKEVKKRAPKAAKKIEEDVAEKGDQQNHIVPVQEDVVTEQPIAVPMKKEVKKRAPKAAKKIEEDVPVQEDVVVAEQPLDVPVKKEKEVKKRGPKAAKKEEVVDDGHKKKSIVVPDDVVIPINEQTILGEDLQEDTYQDYVELNEVFINEVLFYKDANGSWFDALLNPTLDPTL